MQILKLLIILIIMLIGAAFAVMNSGKVTLDYYFGSHELPLSVILVGAIAVGAVLGLIAGLGGKLRLKRENMELRRKARLAVQEVDNLRAIPIKDH